MTKTIAIPRAFGMLLLAACLLGSSSIFSGERLYAAPKAEAQGQVQPAAVVNINAAGSEDLQTLKGIGPALAQRILDYRAEHGRFQKVEQLTEIRGIGEAKFQKFKNQVSV